MIIPCDPITKGYILNSKGFSHGQSKVANGRHYPAISRFSMIRASKYRFHARSYLTDAFMRHNIISVYLHLEYLVRPRFVGIVSPLNCCYVSLYCWKKNGGMVAYICAPKSYDKVVIFAKREFKMIPSSCNVRFRNCNFQFQIKPYFSLMCLSLL